MAEFVKIGPATGEQAEGDDGQPTDIDSVVHG
jgi:hypothetical protein